MYRGLLCRKALSATLLAVMLVVVGFDGYSLWNMRRDRTEEMRGKIEKTADALALSLARPLYHYDSDTALAMLDAIGADPDVAKVEVVDDMQRPVWLLDKKVMQESLGSIFYRDITFTLPEGEKARLGKLNVTMSEQALHRAVDREIVKSLLSLAAMLVTLALSVFWGFRQITRPLQAISTGLLRLAQGEKDFQVEGASAILRAPPRCFGTTRCKSNAWKPPKPTKPPCARTKSASASSSTRCRFRSFWRA